MLTNTTERLRQDTLLRASRRRLPNDGTNSSQPQPQPQPQWVGQHHKQHHSYPDIQQTTSFQSSSTTATTNSALLVHNNNNNGTLHSPAYRYNSTPQHQQQFNYSYNNNNNNNNNTQLPPPLPNNNNHQDHYCPPETLSQSTSTRATPLPCEDSTNHHNQQHDAAIVARQEWRQYGLSKTQALEELRRRHFHQGNSAMAQVVSAQTRVDVTGVEYTVHWIHV